MKRENSITPRRLLWTTVVVIAFLSCGVAEADDERENLLEGVDPSLTYSVVRKHIKMYIGRKVAWVGRFASMQSTQNAKTGATRTTEVYVARDEDGKFSPKNPFVFSQRGDTKATKGLDRAEKNRSGKHRSGSSSYLVIGTVKGACDFQNENGRTVKIPELRDVVLDVPRK